ncbi:hypothetical protein ACOMHN_027172 [Nucella lapillus]
MLSEYHNPNFTRGQPERVTFLERRSQLHDNSGQRKRNKRNSASANAQNQPSSETTSTVKKIKKESSVQVSQSLLPSEDGHSASDNDNSSTKCPELSGKPENGRALPTQTATSAAERRAQTRHSTPVYHHPLSAQKQSSTGGKSVRAGERPLYQRRPYYCHDGLDPRYLRSSLAPPFSGHMSPAWHSPYPPCDPAQMYDHYFSVCGTREEHLYPPSFGPDFRHMVRVRSPQTDHYPPVPYHDGRYFAGPGDPWDVVYRMNRRHAIPVTGGSANDYKGQNMAGKQMRWPQKHPASSYDHDLASPHGRSAMAHDPFPMWPHPPFGSPESRAVVRWRAPDFAGDSHAMRITNNEFRSLVIAKGHDTTHVFHNTFGQSVMRDINNGTYDQTGAIGESPGAWPAGIKKTEDSSTPEAIQKITTDISSDSSLNDVNYREPNGELEVDTSKNEEEVQDCSENLQIITDEVVDLPLDVAEETVVTCNAASVATSDHCLPVVQTSSPEDKMLMDTLMNASASLSPEDTPESYHLPSEKTTSSSRHPYGQGIDIYNDYHSDGMDSQTFSRQFPDSFHSRQDESPKPYSPVCAWRYSNHRQPAVSNGHCGVPEMLPQTWSQFDEQTTSAETSTTNNRHLPLPFSENGAADTEDSPYQGNHASALNEPASNGVDSLQPSSQSKGSNSGAKVLVEREERGDLTQLSSSSVQELLSAALRTPGMKIMVDDHNHPEKMVLVIPKGKRREFNGCV